MKPHQLVQLMINIDNQEQECKVQQMNKTSTRKYSSCSCLFYFLFSKIFPNFLSLFWRKQSLEFCGDITCWKENWKSLKRFVLWNVFLTGFQLSTSIVRSKEERKTSHFFSETCHFFSILWQYLEHILLFSVLLAWFGMKVNLCRYIKGLEILFGGSGNKCGIGKCSIP